MKLVNLLFLVLFSLVASANVDELNRLIEMRKQQEAIYQSLNDSAIANRWVKQTLVFNQLNLIKAIDDSIIDQASLLAKTNAALSDSVSSSKNKMLLLSTDVEKVKARAGNDMQMLLILKIAVAVLLLVVLALIYLLYRKPARDQKTDMLEKKVRELEVERVHIKSEIHRLKTRENQVKDELERGVHLQQEKLDSLSTRNNQLENENISLKTQLDQRNADFEEKINYSLKQLSVERDQLVNQVANLNNQLADAKTKHESMLRKINKLISDLSGVND